MSFRTWHHRPQLRLASAVVAATVAVLGLGAMAAPAVAASAVAAEPAHITGFVSGIQLDPDSAVRAALVTVYPADDPDTAVAVELVRGAGGFDLQLPAGSYRVSARTEARATEWWPEVSSFEAATTVDLAPGATEDLDFTLTTPAASFAFDPSDPTTVRGLGEAGTPLTAHPGTVLPAPDSFTYQWLSGTKVLPGETDATITVTGSPDILLVAITPHKAGYSEWPIPGAWLFTDPTEGLDALLAAMGPEPGTHVSDRVDWQGLRYVVPEGIAVGTRPIRGFPTDGDSYAVLSTGAAAETLEPGDPGNELNGVIGSAPFELFVPTDETRVRLILAPPAGFECLAVDLMFGTEGTLLGPKIPATDPADGDYLSVESPTFDDAEDGHPPNNFARDANGRVIGPGADLEFTVEPDWRVDGWTPPLTARVPLSGESTAGAGYTDVVISVSDQGDSFMDSVVLVDNLRFEPASGCPTDGIVTPIDDSPVIEGTTPHVSGQVRVGSRLTAVQGDWNPDGVAFSYQWLRNGQPIAGATAKAYVPRVRDVLSRLSVRVTGSLAGAEPVTLVSERTARVRLR